MNDSVAPEGDGVPSPAAPRLKYRWLGLLALLLVSAGQGWAAVVTNCTEAALRFALRQDGSATFTNDCSITLATPITVAASNTWTIDAAGHNVTISGGNAVRLFNVSGTLTLVGLQLSNGKHANSGGAMYVQASAVVNAQSCIFTNNTITATNGVAGAAGADSSGVSAGDGGNGTSGVSALGGAIWNGGTVSLSLCSLSNNTVVAGNGGAGGAGGNGTGTLTIAGSGGDGGAGGAAYGGAVYNEGNLTLTDCTLAANSSKGGNGGAGGAAGSGGFGGRAGQGGAGSGGYGGAVFNAQNITVSRCAFSANTTQGGNSAAGGTQTSGLGSDGPRGADAAGGGLCSAWYGNVDNSTFYSNSATAGAGGNGGPGTGSLSNGGKGGNGGNGVGGGVRNSGTLNLVNCTLSTCGAYGGTNGIAGSGTFSNDDGAPGKSLGGNIATAGGTCTLRNSLIISGQSGGCGEGSFADSGYNMTSDNSIALGGNSFPNTANPKAGLFGMYGGPTPTLALLSNSPAIDRIPRYLAPAVDQRGVPRPLGNGADIGAFESAAGSVPIIVQQPADASAQFGNPATFSVFAVGDVPLSYQWFLNGSAITNAASSSYTVASVNSSNLGPYYVQITNSVGSAISSNAFVDFLTAPVIVTQPTDELVAAGSNAFFSVMADGPTPLSYQWQQNGQAISGATDADLVVTNVHAAQLGNYSVIVANPYGGVTSSNAALNLILSFAQQPTNQVAAVGGSATFSVIAEGAPPYTYQWQRTGTNIPNATASSYTINSASMAVAVDYRVVVADSLTKATSSAAMLYLLPAFVTLPTDQVVPAGGSASFQVAAAGTPPLFYQWRRNGAVLPGQTGTRLTVIGVQAGDAGAYSVLVANLFGSTSSPPAMLTIGVAPSIVLAPVDQVIYATGSATFSVVAGGSEPLSYQWQFGGTNINGATGTAYTRVNAGTNHIGAYTVVVNNAFGHAMATAALNLLPTLFSQPQSQALTNGARVDLCVTAVGTPALDYHWRFNETGIVSGTNACFSITNFQAADAGDYTVVVTNAYGSTTSQVAKLELGVAPSVVTQPTNQILDVGGTAVLSVDAAGTAPLRYQWQLGGVDLQGETGTSLTIAGAAVNLAGPYTVAITNAFGGTNSSAAQLLFRPTIFAQPSSVLSFFGRPATLCVGVAGTEPLAYQWRLNGPTVEGGDACLTIPNVQSNNVGSYTLTISNQYGVATSGPVTLNLLPTVLVQPAGQSVLEGSNVVLQVTAAVTVSYQWRFNGARISGATTSAYIFGPASSANSGLYDVVLANGFGTTTSAVARLDVVKPFMISGHVRLDTNGLSGVTVQAGTNSAVTDINGYYALSGLASNAYTVTPSLACYAFGPANRSVVVGSTNAFDIDFSATNDFHHIGGEIRTQDGQLAQAAVSVFLNGTNGTSVVDAAAGKFSFDDVCAGTYSVSLSSSFYVFAPPATNVTVPPDAISLAFSAVPAFTISGQLANSVGAVQVLVVNTDTQVTNVATAVGGNYFVANLPEGEYQVFPVAANCRHFVPPSRMVSLGPNGTANFESVRDSYVISGRLTNGQTGVSGIVVYLGALFTRTREDGSYAFTVPCAGTYTVMPSTPVGTCYQFTPQRLTVTVGPTNALNSDFSAVPYAYNISGFVRAGNSGLSNVTVVAAGPTPSTNSTGPDGSYTITNLCPGTYTVTPSLTCYFFNPGSRSVTVGPNIEQVNFAAYQHAGYTVQGRITSQGGAGLTNVSVTVGGQSALTDTNGNYIISNLCPGSYVVTPSLANYGFDPPSRLLNLVASTNGVNFVGFRVYTLAGQITGDGIQLANISVQAGNQTTNTDERGAYVFSNLRADTYTVTPSQNCVLFIPDSLTVSLSGDTNGIDFFGIPNNVFALRGSVTEGGVYPVTGVTLQLAGQAPVVTGPDGGFSFLNVCDGTNTITPSLANYTFRPPSMTFSVTGDLSGLSFLAVPEFNIRRLDNSTTHLTSFGTTGAVYYIDTSTNLLDWQPFTNGTPPLDFLDDRATNSVKFYRLSR